MPHERLNYHHLLYFWLSAKEGSLSKAAAQLELSHPTLSTQVRALEDHLGERLFRKKGRHLEMTEMGRLVFAYADDIFGLGRELLEAVRQGGPLGQPRALRVGVTDSLPKLVTRRLLEPALRLPALRLECYEEGRERLLARLLDQELDVILCDAAAGAGAASSGKVFSHLLGECGVALLGAPALVKRLQPQLPESLQQAPVLLPTRNCGLRQALDDWFATRGLQPRIVAEIEDSALLKTFAQDGLGLVAVHEVIEGEACRQYDLVRLQRLDEVRDRFYALSAERKLRHPGVQAITQGARHGVFAPAARSPRTPR
jgi:LysR family transcriptional activator of nhaA